MSHTIHSATELVVSRLEGSGFGPQPTGGDQYESRCPGHNGSRRNLSIATGDDGRCLVHCHHEPSCSPQSIVEAIGLKFTDLFQREPIPTRQIANGKPRDHKRHASAPPTGAERLGQPSSTWVYHGLDGGEVLRVNRFDRPDPGTGKPTKTYRPQHLASDGWREGDPPGPLPLYRLLDLPDAETILVCEGEKVVEAVRKLGLIATTSAHGAGSPHKSDWTVLAGKKVIMSPDFDRPGDAYKEKIIDLLGKLDPRPTVQVVDLSKLWPSDSPIPEGADLADWVELRYSQGATPEECKRSLESVIASTPETDLCEARMQADSLSVSVSGDRCEPIEDSPIVARQWPAPVAKEALYGLPGEIVGLIEPNSEADPMAVLIQLLVGFGNMIGRSAYVVLGPCRHYANEFAVLVGATSVARKGTSLAEVMRFLAPCDPDWKANRVRGGLSTGEGLIHTVRDATTKSEPIKEKGKITGHQQVQDDPGEPDKRLWVTESELASVLKVMTREGNSLSPVIRDAWDKGDLGTLTRNSPLKATNAHISMVGHITQAELSRQLTKTDMENGFANRFLWIAVQRSKLLPLGESAPQAEVDRLVAPLKSAMIFARRRGEIGLTREALELWVAEYPRLSSSRPGALGSVTCRAEAHVRRLALLYALLDKSPSIKSAHFWAALACWNYSFRSSVYIFGDRVGDRQVDAILNVLKFAENGLTREEIRNQVFNRNMPSHRIAEKLQVLVDNGLARSTKVSTGKPGRQAERWFTCDPNAENALITPDASPASISMEYRVNGVALPSDDDPAEEDSDIEKPQAEPIEDDEYEEF